MKNTRNLIFLGKIAFNKEDYDKSIKNFLLFEKYKNSVLDGKTELRLGGVLYSERIGLSTIR